MALIRTEGPLDCRIEIGRGASWADAIPQITDPQQNNEAPLDLTGKTFELWVRPTTGHAELLKLLTSNGSAGIYIDNAAQGLVSIFLSKSQVDVNLPAGDWEQFMLMNWVDGAFGEINWLFWRGQMKVLPGNSNV